MEEQNDIFEALRVVSKSVNGGSMTLDEMLKKAPTVSVSIRIPAATALAVEVLAGEAGQTRHDYLRKILLQALAVDLRRAHEQEAEGNERGDAA